mmetsp:Transcript_14872/g.20840  ORF Transcript_14872/g.20840 Transcript_14872/m.20840 type:complete len:152 (+) Transcript_14872:1140-1595(+)
MGRLYSDKKGISSTVVPYKRYSNEWKGLTMKNLTEIVIKLARKGLAPSQIGLLLRDSFTIVDVKNITGMNITKILSLRGVKYEIPEDLYSLVCKAMVIKRHLELHKKDQDSEHRLKLIESHIYRLSKYYKRTSKLPSNWKYKNLKKVRPVV